MELPPFAGESSESIFGIATSEPLALSANLRSVHTPEITGEGVAGTLSTFQNRAGRGGNSPPLYSPSGTVSGASGAGVVSVPSEGGRGDCGAVSAR